jgi:hypothetical protein
MILLEHCAIRGSSGETFSLKSALRASSERQAYTESEVDEYGASGKF